MMRLEGLIHCKITDDPLTPDWKGANAHIGPVQTITPLVRLISGKTTCGTVALMSGLLLWGAERLRPFTNVDFLDELATAIFAWQIDWRYLQPVADPRGKAPDQPVAESAAMALRGLVVRSVLKPNDWYSFYQPIMSAFHMANITRFIMAPPDVAHFSDWLRASCDRLDVIAAVPDIEEPVFAEFESKAAYYSYCAPRRGPPLPPIVLDPKAELSGLDLNAEAQKFIASLDHTKNRYLKSPALMLEEGFEGTPYGLAP